MIQVHHIHAYIHKCHERAIASYNYMLIKRKNKKYACIKRESYPYWILSTGKDIKGEKTSIEKGPQ